MKLRQIKEHLNNKKCFVDHERMTQRDDCAVYECSKGHTYTYQFLKNAAPVLIRKHFKMYFTNRFANK